MKILFDLTFIRSQIFMGISNYAFRILDYILIIKKQDDFELLLNPISYQHIIKMYPQFEYSVVGNAKISKIPCLGTIYMSYIFKRTIDTRKVDLLFCPWGNTISCLKIRTPKISVIHDLQFRKDTKGLLLLMRKIVDDLVIKHSNLIVTISEFSRKQILDYYPNLSNKLLSLGNVVSYSPSYSTKYIDGEYILYVGRICKMKNILTLIKAYIKIHKIIKHKLIIVGNENNYWRKEILPFIKINGIKDKILILENISNEELNGLYKHTSLFVFPSLREGFGYPPIEAAYMEVPVLCSKCDSLPEVTMELLNYYENPIDENELSQKILLLLNQPRNTEKLKQIASIYKKEYGVETVSKRIYECIVSFCGK